MSGFWTSIRDEKSSHRRIRQLAHEHDSHFEFPLDHGVDNYRDYYGPFLGHEPQYANPNDYSHMYHPPPGDVEEFCTPLSPCMQSVMENIKLIEQNNVRFELQALYDHPYNDISEFPFSSEPHVPPCTEYPYEMRIPTSEDSHSIEQINMILKMNLIHLQSEERKEFHDEMFVVPNEVNFENCMSGPTHVTDTEYEPHPEKNELTENTKVVNRDEYAYYSDDDMMLEEIILLEDAISESCDSEMPDHSGKTYIDNVSSNIHIHCNSYDFGINLGLVKLFCEREHDIQDEHDIGKAEFFVDANDHMPENEFDVSDSLPRSLYVADSSDAYLGTLDSHDSELGLVNLFYEDEHDVVHVSDLGRVESCNDTDKNNLDRSDSLLKSQHDCLNVGQEVVKPTLWTSPSFGLELCASQVLLDYFAAKYNTFDEPQLEFTRVCLTIPRTVHFELALVHDAPLKLLDFVPKSMC